MTMKSEFLKSLELLEAHAQEKPLNLKEVFEILGDRSHLILILFLDLPFVQPVPVPGLSTVLGLLIVFIAVLNYLEKPIHLPRWFKEKNLSQALVISTSKVAEKIWHFLEKFLRVRGDVFFKTKFFKGFNALVLCIQALLLCLPLPLPFSNTIPAVVIAVNVIGELEEDGLVVVISYILGLGSIAFFVALAFGVKSGLHFIS